MTRNPSLRPQAPQPAPSIPQTAAAAPPPPSTAPAFDPASYTEPFLDFITSNPTTFHVVSHIGTRLASHGFEHLSARSPWRLRAGGKYYTTRNGSSLIAFTIGSGYTAGGGAAMIAAHVDALAARVKPMSTKPASEGYVRLGVAPYAGALSASWMDRDLGIGGRVFVRDDRDGTVSVRLARLPWPVARIPSIAPHFGLREEAQPNRETRMVPIIGLLGDDGDGDGDGDGGDAAASNNAGRSFAATQPPRLLRAIAAEMGLGEHETIVNWELELFDVQPAQLGGLDRELIFAGRIDDRLCSWAALEALLLSGRRSEKEKENRDGDHDHDHESGIVKLVGLFDDEEVGSLLRQGARSNFLPSTMERICEAFATDGKLADTLGRTYANSFLISADVCHAYNPNYSDVYLDGHRPRLNVGVVVSSDSNAHMATDGLSTALLSAVAAKAGCALQRFQIRNDSRSGGTVGPMLSSAMGVRAVDAGIPQLSMHSIRATTGSLDPGLGVKLFAGFFDSYEETDAEFV